MAFQFCCPQGHVLQGDPSQVGQLFQCPYCGGNFLIPAPEMSPPPAASFFQGPGAWPAPSPAESTFAPPGGVPGMPAMMPLTPGGPGTAGPFSSALGQQFSFGQAAVNPPAQTPPQESPQRPPSPAPQLETDRQRFELGFDPLAKDSLPFDLPGDSDRPAAPVPAAGLPPPAFPGPSFPPPAFPGPAFTEGETHQVIVPQTAEPMPFALGSGGQDFLLSAPRPIEDAAERRDPPKILHIRCPAGHLVKATSDLLGKNGRCPACKKTFELRYENSLEFQRRKEKILDREEVKANKAWIAWSFLAAFVVIVGLIVLMLSLSR